MSSGITVAVIYSLAVYIAPPPLLVNIVSDAVIEVIGMLDFRSFFFEVFLIKSAGVLSIFSRHRLS